MKNVIQLFCCVLFVFGFSAGTASAKKDFVFYSKGKEARLSKIEKNGRVTYDSTSKTKSKRKGRSTGAACERPTHGTSPEIEVPTMSSGYGCFEESCIIDTYVGHDPAIKAVSHYINGSFHRKQRVGKVRNRNTPDGTFFVTPRDITISAGINKPGTYEVTTKVYYQNAVLYFSNDYTFEPFSAWIDGVVHAGDSIHIRYRLDPRFGIDFSNQNYATVVLNGVGYTNLSIDSSFDGFSDVYAIDLYMPLSDWNNMMEYNNRRHLTKIVLEGGESADIPIWY